MAVDTVWIEIAGGSDHEFIVARDHHIAKERVDAKIRGKKIYIPRKANHTIGWMLFLGQHAIHEHVVDEEYRGKGYGAHVVQQWGNDMRTRGFATLMTSTQSNEEAQHFYRKLGFRDAGCLLQENEPLELILSKKL